MFFSVPVKTIALVYMFITERREQNGSGRNNFSRLCMTQIVSQTNLRRVTDLASRRLRKKLPSRHLR